MPVDDRVSSGEDCRNQAGRDRLLRLAVGALGLFWVGVLLVLMR